MFPKIVFILNSIQHPRCKKRIDEFISSGYEVDVYGFNRNNGMLETNDYTCIGIINKGDSFLKRLHIMRNALLPIANRYKNSHVYFYYFGLDIAIVGTYLNSKPYFYEESDLVHTYHNRIIKNILEMIDCRIIKNSFETILTSEGFKIYHFNNQSPNNVSIIPNKLNPQIVNIAPAVKHANIDMNSLHIAFVGAIRFYSVIRMAMYIARNFPNYTVHFYGGKMPITDSEWNSLYEACMALPNVAVHGAFKNPDDLPSIYSQTDLLISTYDIEFENVQYAEPNKIYEAIYFKTPIIVSKETFLADKVSKLGIGYSVNPNDESEIISFFKSLTLNSINSCEQNCSIIPKSELINCNVSFFTKLSDKFQMSTSN